MIFVPEPFFLAFELLQVALDMTEINQHFRSMSLSFRGAERQPPTLLQMALRFSRVMELQEMTVSGNTETRLKAAIDSFNSCGSLNVRHQLDDDKRKSLLNLLVGTTKAIPCLFIEIVLHVC